MIDLFGIYYKKKLEIVSAIYSLKGQQYCKHWKPIPIWECTLLIKGQQYCKHWKQIPIWECTMLIKGQ